MRKSFAYFFLTCSLILVLGHSVLPHSHIARADSSCEVTEAKDLSIADIIKLALAQNIGLNHLEEFNNCPKDEIHSDNYCDYLLISDLSNDPPLKIPMAQKIKISAYQLVIPGVIGACASLRAPPAHS